MDIAKIIKVADFIKVAQAYSEQLQNPKAIASTLGELRTKLESFINKHLVKLNKDAGKKPEKITDLVEFLLAIDKYIPHEDFFKHTQLEIFTTLFKLTFYQREYAVINHEQVGNDGYLGLKILDHEFVNEKVDQITHHEAKCNFIVNNLLIKMLNFCDHQKLLISVAELMYSQDKIKSTQKVAKLLVYFGKLFEVVTQDRPKYLQGSLFALGGLLKLEAKSYLKTLEERRENFEYVCPLFNEESEMDKQEKQRVGVLTSEDQDYFETDLIDVIVEFVRSIVKQSKGAINNEIWDFYIDFSQEKFIDEYEDEKRKDRNRLYGIESAHYVICFLFDLVQFIFQFLVKTEEVKHHEEVKEEGAPRKIFDYRLPIKGEELVCLNSKYYFDKMENVITEIFEGIKSICPNQQHLLWFWQIKAAEVEKKWDEPDEAKDSYDRQDNYNVLGLSTYLFFTTKKAICNLTNTSQILEKLTYGSLNEYQSPISNVFMFECLMPLINYSLRSKSKTLSSIGFEAAGFWTFLSQSSQPIYSDLGHFTKDDQSILFMIQTVYVNMGNLEMSEQAQRLSMKTVFQILSLFEADARVKIFVYLFQILDEEKNDRALSVLISQFYKVFCDKDPKIFFLNAIEIFELTLNCMKEDQYILELTERLQASLNLYIYLVLRERNLLKQGIFESPIITEAKYQDETIKKGYFESLVHTIQAGFTSLDEEQEKVGVQDETFRQGIMSEIARKRNALTMLQAVLSQANSL